MSKELEKYLETEKVNATMASYVASLEKVKEVSPEVASSIVCEIRDQRSYLKLIASENYCSPAVQFAMGNLLTDKYSEGYPYHRFYSGCDNVDIIEAHADELACDLFGADHAYMQPHSGADANLVAFWAIINHKIQNPALEKIGITNVSELSRDQWNEIRKITGNQRLLGLDYYSGGHLTHGYRQNISAQMFDAYSYSVDKETGLIDYKVIEEQAMEIKPLILLAGYSAYPRLIDFKKMSEIAHECGAVFMVDMAHFCGLVAGKQFTGNYDPIPWADVVTTTTHKTLRGPRGGMILCKEEFSEAVDKGCPLVIGGPLPHVMAAKAVALTEAGKPEFQKYAENIIKNAKVMAEHFMKDGMKIQTNGTDNHLMLLDVTQFGINGKQAEAALRECAITLNRNALPFDKNGPWYTSGLRIGTPAVTTLKMGENEMKEIADVISLILKNTKPKILTKGPRAGQPSKIKYILDEKVKEAANNKIHSLLKKFLLYPELDLQFLEDNFEIK